LSRPRPFYQDQNQEKDSGSQDQDLHNFQDQGNTLYLFYVTNNFIVNNIFFTNLPFLCVKYNTFDILKNAKKLATR